MNLRATLDDLDVLVAASKPATKDLARFLSQLRPLVQEARPTIADLNTLVHRKGANNDLTDLLGKAPALEQRRQAVVRALDHGAAEGHAGASSSSGPTRPTSSAGCATSARARRTTTPTATSPASSRSSTPTRSTDNPAGGTLTPIPPSQRLAGLQTGQVRRCPGAASQPPADGSAPFRDIDGSLDCDPSLVLPGP